MMKSKNKNNINEKLQKATSQMIVDVIISFNADTDDISSGKYRPVSNMASLINLEELLVRRNVQSDTTKPKKR